MPREEKELIADLPSTNHKTWNFIWSELKNGNLFKTLLISVIPLNMVTLFKLRLPVLDADFANLHLNHTINGIASQLDALFCLGAALAVLLIAKISFFNDSKYISTKNCGCRFKKQNRSLATSNEYVLCAYFNSILFICL